MISALLYGTRTSSSGVLIGFEIGWELWANLGDDPPGDARGETPAPPID